MAPIIVKIFVSQLICGTRSNIVSSRWNHSSRSSAEVFGGDGNARTFTEKSECLVRMEMSGANIS